VIFFCAVGKLPAKGACEETLERIRKYEETIINKLLSKYIALCDKVRKLNFILSNERNFA